MVKSFTKAPWSIDSSDIVVYTPSPGDPTFVGTTGNNTFNISAGSPNIVFGLGGNDIIKSAGGNNFVYSGDFTTKYNTGNDTITLLNETSSNFNYIHYGNANDTISISGNSQNFIMGGIGNTKVTVTTGAGTVGSTTTDLGPGNDTVKLGAGNDSVLFNVPLDGISHNTYDGGAGTDTLSLAFASVADLNTFTSVFTPIFGPNFVNFAATDASSTFNFGKYDSQLNLKVTHFENLVLDVNPTAVADTTTVNVGLADVPNTPFLLVNDVGYLGHSLNLSSMSAPVSSSPSNLIVTADYAAFVPTLGNPPTGEFATFDLTPQGSNQHALLTIYNNGNYSISNVAVLDSVIQANPDIHLSFNYMNGDGFGGHASSTAQINFLFNHDVIEAITNPAAQSGMEDAPFALSNAALFSTLFTQTENDTYSLAVSGLPAGLTYDAATGITGTPTVEEGIFNILVTATNTDPNESSHSSATNTLTINMADAPDIFLSTPSIGNVTATEGGPSFATPDLHLLPHTEMDDPLTFTLINGSGNPGGGLPPPPVIPPGFSFDPTTGILSGTPDDPQVGTYTYQIIASTTGGHQSTSAFSNVFTVTINDAFDSIVAGIPIPASILLGKEGMALATPYDVTQYFAHSNPLEADDTIHYVITSGTLLPGLTLSPDGQITGTPTGDVFSSSVVITATSQDANNGNPMLSENFIFTVTSPFSITIDNSLLVPEQTTIPLAPSHHGNLFAGDGVLVGQLSDTASGTPHYSVIGGAFLDGSAVALAVNPFEVIGDSLALIPGDSVPVGFQTALITIDDGLGHQQNLTLTENTTPSIIIGSDTGDGTAGSNAASPPVNGTNGSASISDTSANDLLVGANGGNGGDGGTGNFIIHGGNGGSGSYLITSIAGHDTIYGGDGGTGGDSIAIVSKNGGTTLPGAGGAGTYTIDASGNLSSVVIYGGDGGNGGAGTHGGIGHYSIIGGVENDVIYGGNGGNEGHATPLGPGASAFYTIQAGSGNDTIFMGTGGLGDSTVVIGGETLHFAGHYDVNGGAGNDTIHFGLNSSFTTGMSINGGTGIATFVTDTPLVTTSTSTAFTLDAAAIGGQLTNITHLNLATTNDAVNTVALSVEDVLDMTPASHTLFVEGTSNDTVNVATGAGWASAGIVSDAFTGLSYDSYTQESSILNIEHGTGIHTMFV